MDFNFSEEQVLLQDSVDRFLADRYDFARRQAAIRSPAGRAPDIWKGLAEELGVLGAPFAEDLGGLGGGPVEVMILMEAFGKALLVEPFLETVVIGGGLLRRAGTPLAAGLIAGIIGGEVVIAFAHTEPDTRFALSDVGTTATRTDAGWRLSGVKDAVSAAPWATHLIVTARSAGDRRDRDGISLFVVERDAAGVTLRDYPTVDDSRAADVRLECEVGPDALIGEAGRGMDLLEPVGDEAVAALCAEAVGCMRRVHADTIDYARQRKQFRTPIASFQVLQHRMVDMFMALELAVSMTFMATLKLQEPAAERALAASAAKVQCGKSGRLIGQGAIQIHGGMGMTDELAVSHYFKRLSMIDALFGGVDHHLARYEATGPVAA